MRVSLKDILIALVLIAVTPMVLFFALAFFFWAGIIYSGEWLFKDSSQEGADDATV